MTDYTPPSMKDAHEYIPERDTDFTGGMGRGYCVAFVLLSIIGFIVAYFLI